MKTIMLGSLIAALSLGAWAAEGVRTQAATEDQKRESQQEYLSGIINYDKGDYAQARQDWERALKSNPANADAAAGLERISKFHQTAKSGTAAKEPVSFVMDSSMHGPDGSWFNANAEDFMRRHASSGGVSVRLAAGDDGRESACANTKGAWACRVGKDSAMSEGLYRFILAQVAPSSAAPDEQGKRAPLKSDSAGLFTGYRGVSLSLPGHQVAFLKKGDYVDVMVTFDAKMADKRKEKVTATILQNVRVVEVLKPAKTEERGTVQILLNPNEAQYAALSDAQGDLHIALRAPGDTEMHPMEMASFRKLFR